MKVLLSASGVYLAELFDTQSRNIGITLARTSSDPIGGLTRLIATALPAWSGAYLSVALFLLLFVLIGLVSVYLGRETHDAAFESDPRPCWSRSPALMPIASSADRAAGVPGVAPVSPRPVGCAPSERSPKLTPEAAPLPIRTASRRGTLALPG